LNAPIPPAHHWVLWRAPREAAGGWVRPRAVPLGRATPLPHPLTMRCCSLRGPPAKRLGVGSASRRNPGPSPPPHPTSALSSRDRAPFGGGTWGGFTSLWAQAPRDGPSTLCPRCHRACDDSAKSTALSECSFRLFAKSQAVASLELEGGSGDPPFPAHHECLLIRASCARAAPCLGLSTPPLPLSSCDGALWSGSKREP
jgi:hypothetical protein